MTQMEGSILIIHGIFIVRKYGKDIPHNKLFFAPFKKKKKIFIHLIFKFVSHSATVVDI